MYSVCEGEKMRKFFIIINKKANHGTAAENWKKVEQVLNSRNVNFVAKSTTNPGDAFSLANRFAKNLKPSEKDDYVVMVVGGDGTLNDAINGIKAADNGEIPLSFIPSGNNNNFATGIGLASDPLIALEQTLNATESSYYDIGEYTNANNHEQGYFLNDFGVGLDAYIISLKNQMKKHPILRRLHLGFIPYIFHVFEAYTNQEPFNVRVRVNQHYDFFKEAYLVNIANHPYYSGKIQLTPKADINDHKLDLIVAEHMNFFNFLLLGILLYFRKQVKLPSVHYYKESSIHISIDSLEFNQIDGEEKSNKYYDLYFNAKHYPFWVNVASVPLEKRNK